MSDLMKVSSRAGPQPGGAGDAGRTKPSEDGVAGAFSSLVVERKFGSPRSRQLETWRAPGQLDDSLAPATDRDADKVAEAEGGTIYGLLAPLWGAQTVVSRSDWRVSLTADQSGPQSGTPGGEGKDSGARDRLAATESSLANLLETVDQRTGAALGALGRELSLNVDGSGQGETALTRLTFETGVHISAVAFETHFPAAVASTLPELRAEGVSPTRLDAKDARVVHEGLQQAGGRIKILHITLEPETLGKIEVKMRMGRARLDIEITPTTHDTLALLDRSRDELVRVVGGAGVETQDVAIQINPVTSGGFMDSNAEDGGAGQTASSFDFGGDRGPRDGERSGNETRNEPPRLDKVRLEKDGRRSFNSDGVYL